MNSELFSCVGKMPERRTAQIKAPIAVKAQSTRCAHGASFNKAIAKVGNAEVVHFNKPMLIHELIRGSLESSSHQCGSKQQEGADRHQGRQQGVQVQHQAQITK